MKIAGNAIKVGNILKLNGNLCIVTKTQHTQPGKGGAYMQTELKELVSNRKFLERFRSSEMVERAYLEEHEFQFLYLNDNFMVLMDMETFEQQEIETSFLGDDVGLLKENIMLKVLKHDGKTVFVKLPDTIDVEVIEAEPIVKGQTAASSFKPAVIEGGVKVMVPPHITIGDKIVINTSDKTYLERVKQ